MGLNRYEFNGIIDTNTEIELVLSEEAIAGITTFLSILDTSFVSYLNYTEKVDKLVDLSDEDVSTINKQLRCSEDISNTSNINQLNLPIKIVSDGSVTDIKRMYVGRDEGGNLALYIVPNN